MEFLIGGTAAMGACLFTNPLEVLKTRFQLQGELKAKGQHAVHYKNVIHAGYVIIKNDGILALQKGLVPALWVQLVLNGARLGFYGLTDSLGYLRDENGNLKFARAVLLTGTGSVIGQVLSSPFFLVKTHLQSQATSAIAVGHQHDHVGSFRALGKIYKANGVKGLFRGATASVPRTFVGGSSQLIAFDYAKQCIDAYGITNKPLLRSFLASMAGGVVISLVMCPFDLILTRIYNQPTDTHGKGLFYRSYFDCVRKIYESEGLLAFYKGIGPMYLRLGPHTVLCLVFWDELNLLYNNFFMKEAVNDNL